MVFLIIVVLGGIFLLVAAWVLAQQNNPSSPAGGVQTEDPEAGGGRISTPEVSRISLADAKAAFDSGTAFFLDVRSAESFAASHILGAYNIPLAELPQRMGELNPADWIITYCTWPAEESSARAAQTLLEAGFTQVNPILGGFAAWVEADYPVQP